MKAAPADSSEVGGGAVYEELRAKREAQRAAMEATQREQLADAARLELPYAADAGVKGATLNGIPVDVGTSQGARVFGGDRACAHGLQLSVILGKKARLALTLLPSLASVSRPARRPSLARDGAELLHGLAGARGRLRVRDPDRVRVHLEKNVTGLVPRRACTGIGFGALGVALLGRDALSLDVSEALHCEPVGLSIANVLLARA